MGRPVVLVLTQPMDPHVDFVIESLATRDVEVVRFDTADFPRRSHLRAHIGGDDGVDWLGALETNGRLLDWQRLTGIWYRRPQEFELDPELSEPERKFGYAESLMTIGGLLRGTRALWVNHPEKNSSATYKPYQLALARRCGLDIPKTLLTNEPAAVRDFFEECAGQVIYKTLSSPMSSIGETPWTIYTTAVTARDLAEVDRVRRVPCLIQERVSRRSELRVIVFGDQMFPVEINAPADVLDWRTDYPRLTYQSHMLPPDVAAGLARLVSALDLQFAAIDLIITPDGRYVFLELNPNGQWAWLESRTGLPMARALIDLLVLGVRQPAIV